MTILTPDAQIAVLIVTFRRQGSQIAVESADVRPRRQRLDLPAHRFEIQKVGIIHRRKIAQNGNKRKAGMGSAVV